ncbi:MAG: GNAT family N-acetyltransferase, partial [Planctomycetota bacterium]|nr:GNAT family N-acetyltransferase [Planctomycetota bacterium]
MVNAADAPAGFMGIKGSKIEMLFLDPAFRGHGLGRRMIEFAVKEFGADSLN